MTRLTPDPRPKQEIILPEDQAPRYEDMTFQGGALGLNSAGVFVAPDGRKWYVKTPRVPEQTFTELLAGALYRQSGLRAPMTTYMDTPRGPGIASLWVENLEPRTYWGIYDQHQGADWPGTVEGFVMDAWLANHDIVTPDNLVLHPSGEAFRVDPGGSLYYRAQGGRKPWDHYPNPAVIQIESLRDPRFSYAAETFSGVSDSTLRRDAPAMLGPITPEIITDLTHRIVPPRYEPDRYVEDLIARRAELLRRYE